MPISSDKVFDFLKAKLNDQPLPESNEVDKRVAEQVINLIKSLDQRETFDVNSEVALCIGDERHDDGEVDLAFEQQETFDVDSEEDGLCIGDEQHDNGEVDLTLEQQETFDVDSEEDGLCIGDEQHDDKELDPDFEPLEIGESSNMTSHLSYEYCKAVVDYKDAHPTHSFRTLQCRFRKLKNYKCVTRCRSYVAKMGTKREKYLRISQYVIEKFNESRAVGNVLRDDYLKRFAMSIARGLNCNDFKASDSWLLNFKRKYNIVSRTARSAASKKATDGERIQDESQT